MRNLFLMFVIAALPATGLAQGLPRGVPIWNGPPTFPMPLGTDPSAVEHADVATGVPEMVWDVTNATLLPYIPTKRRASVPAVLVLPGGGGRILSLARSVATAEALRSKGIAAFVLKYRTMPLQLTPEQLKQQMTDGTHRPPAPIGQPRTAFEDINREVNAPSPYREMQIADMMQALKVIKSNLSWGIDPSRVALAGQSNGSILVAEFLDRHGAGHGVRAAALLYGAPPRAITVSDVPLFVSSAGDDVLTHDGSLQLYQAWKAAGKPAEIHLYASGGHGFRIEGTSGAASWLDDFVRWAIPTLSR